MILDWQAKLERRWESLLRDSESYLLRYYALLLCTLLLRLIWTSLTLAIIMIIRSIVLVTLSNVMITLSIVLLALTRECKSEHDTVSSVSFFYSYLKWIHLFMIALVFSFHLATVSLATLWPLGAMPNMYRNSLFFIKDLNQGAWISDLSAESSLVLGPD